MAYTATETAFAECVDGKPYSRAADPDMVIRWRGGDRGRGREKKSLTKPVKKTPVARICTILVACQPNHFHIPSNIISHHISVQCNFPGAI